MADTKIELHPESTGLVIVDMQVEGCERHGPGMKPVIGSIRRLLDRFRAVNGKIIHVSPFAPRITRNLPSSDGLTACCWAARRGLRRGIAAAAGRKIVQKTSHDCFYKTSMEAMLKSSTSGRAGTRSSSPASARATAFIMR